MTLQSRESLIERWNETNDEWGKYIVCCLELCNELVAEEPKYHTNCMIKFHLKDGTDKRRRRPEGFKRMPICLEKISDCKMYTVQKIHLKMAELSNPGNVCIAKWLKQKSKEQYQENLYFTELPGLTDVVCFRDMASYEYGYGYGRNPLTQKKKLSKLQSKWLKRFNLQQFSPNSVSKSKRKQPASHRIKA